MDKKEVIHGLSSKEDALASKKSIIHRFNVPVSVVSEPKPECDHIVGKIDFSEDHLYEMSWTELKEFFLERDITWHLTDMENIRLKWMGSIASDFVPFDHCHLCGEKIDLQAVIESTKKLNLKKDE